MADKKFTIGIEAVTAGALSEINKVINAQENLSESTQVAKNSLKDAGKVAGDVKTYKSLQTAHKFTQGEIEHTTFSLKSLEDKQKQHIGLTDKESVSVQQHGVTVKELNNKLEKTGKLSEVEQKRLIKSKSEYDRLNNKKTEFYKLTAKEQAEVNRLTAAMGKLNAKEKQQISRLGELNTKLDKAGLNTNDLAMAQAVANRRTEKAAQLLERENRLLERSNKLKVRQKAAMKDIGSTALTGMKATTATAVGGGLVASKLSMDNEAGFVDVAKNLNFTLTDEEKAENDRREKNGETTAQAYKGKDAQLLRIELNKLAQKMAGVSEADVMAIAAGGANGGIERDKIAEYTKDTVMTATAWDMSAEDAALKGTALRNSMGYKDDKSTEEDEGRSQFLRMANMINDVANNNGGVSGKDLLDVMSRTGALLTNSGFTEEGALGLSGALLSKGASAEEAGTATKNISKALTAGFSATSGQKEIYDMIGMDAEDVSGSMQDDALGTLSSVLNGLSNLDEEQQSAAIGQLFGQEVAPHVQKLIKDQKVLNKIQQDAANAKNDSVQKEYESIASTNASKIERNTQAFGRLGIALGDKLLPVVMPLIDWAGDMASEFADFINESETAGTAIASLVGIVGSMGAGFAMFKAYKGFKFAKNIAGIASEALALKKAQGATDKLTRSLNSYSNAANNRTRREGGTRRQRTRSRTLSTRRSRNPAARLFGGISNLTGGFNMPFGGNTPRTPRPRGRRRRGMFAAGASLLAGGFAAPTMAGGLTGGGGLASVADAAGAATDVAEMLPLKSMGKLLKGFRPVAMGLDALTMGQAVMNGDGEQAAASGGGILGGMGGAALGATIGTFILPGIGTAIGAGIGGMLGDNVGSEIGSSVFNWFSSEELPDKTEEIKAAQTKTAVASQTPVKTEHFSPQITIQGGKTTEVDTDGLIATLREKWEEWTRERDEDLNQNIAHSLVD